MLTIATWNVNSVKARLSHLLEWLKRAQPDIVLLQELKCTEDTFPALEIEDLGYNLAIHGEKTYNGVAILSKFKLDDIRKGIPGNEDDPHARYIEALAHTPAGVLRIASVYVPNGQETTSDKFQYKLKFLDRFYAHMQMLLSYDEMLVVGGDYNIAPDDADVHDPKAWAGSVLTHDEVRRRFRKILYLGMYDAQVVTSCQLPVTRNQQLATGNYTWWDYRNNALIRDDGLRIDHLLLSPQTADNLKHCDVHRDVRALEKASDHAPVTATFNV
jgi:exodeoxyribonuclease-3